jgi:nucleoside-diphosphate-sugar epimerase
MQSRDFTYVDNVVDANLAACTAEGVDGEVFNVGCGKKFSILDIVQYVNATLGKSVTPLFTSVRKGDVRHTLADTSKAVRLLGYSARVSFQDGLKRTIAWFSSFPK